jgi:hypothetical protein
LLTHDTTSNSCNDSAALVDAANVNLSRTLSPL